MRWRAKEKMVKRLREGKKRNVIWCNARKEDSPLRLVEIEREEREDDRVERGGRRRRGR